MQFDDLQKIWDAQRNETLYAINEQALHKRIKSKKQRIERSHRIDTIGLILISIVVSAILLFIKSNSIFNVGATIMLIGIAVYVFVRDRARRQSLKKFDKNILGDLDHSIKNLRAQIRFSKTFWLWYVIPLGIPKLVELLYGEVKYWSVFVLLCGFTLAILLTNWGARVKYQPQLDKLIKLRDNFINGESKSSENQ